MLTSMMGTDTAGLAHVSDVTVEAWPEETAASVTKCKLRAMVGGVELM